MIYDRTKIRVPHHLFPPLVRHDFWIFFGIGCVGHGFWFEYRFAAAAAAAAAAGVAGAHDDAEDDDDDDEDGEDASAAKIEHPTQGAL